MLPISPDTLHDELKAARALLDKWIQKIGVDGIPNIDKPGADDTALGEFLVEFVGELQVVAGKCETISDVIGRFLEQ